MSSSTRSDGTSEGVDVAAEIRAIAADRGWPDDVARRVIEARVPLSTLRMWGWDVEAERVEKQLAFHERLTTGDLRGRQATMGDNEAFSELWADSPERIGDWEIITERGPDAFAQYKLQENVTLSVFARAHELVACVSWSRRKVFVAGRRLTVTYGQGLRVRDSARRQGFGDQVRRLPWLAAATRPNHTQYDIMRVENFAAVNWWTKYDKDFFDAVPKNEGEVPGIPVTVSLLPARAAEDDPAIRKARREDVPRCVELINRSHAGLDLFRPYSVDFLENVLDEGFWGEFPEFYRPVYGWDDYRVLEEGGRIVACAGLWDRGRDVRERWRHKDGEEERVISDTALLDFGWEAGAADAMARLVRDGLGRTHDLGRDHLVVSLDHQPALAAALVAFEPATERRALRWSMPDVPCERPYTDLRYW